MLPLLAADGRFQVLTMAAGVVRLFEASRYNLLQVHSGALPGSLMEEMGPADSGNSYANNYENPVQASPIARRHTGSINISHGQVYGDSPAEWTKARLVEFTRRVAAAIDERSAADPVPVVLVAGSELGGHFRGFTTLGPLLAGVIETNPEAMDQAQLHEAAYATIRPVLDTERTKPSPASRPCSAPVTHAPSPARRKCSRPPSKGVLTPCCCRSKTTHRG